MIGENRPQEVTAKAEGLLKQCAQRGFTLGAATAEVVAGGAVAGDADGTHIPFHLIGQLQSNKIGKVLPVVNTIESVDSVDLAEKISRRAVARGITVGVLLEVNESGEASKSGCDPAHAIRIAQKIGTLDGLELQGLMTIGAHVDDETTIRYGARHRRRLYHCARRHRHLRRARVHLASAHTFLPVGMIMDPSNRGHGLQGW